MKWLCIRVACADFLGVGIPGVLMLAAAAVASAAIFAPGIFIVLGTGGGGADAACRGGGGGGGAFGIDNRGFSAGVAGAEAARSAMRC